MAVSKALNYVTKHGHRFMYVRVRFRSHLRHKGDWESFPKADMMYPTFCWQLRIENLRAHPTLSRFEFHQVGRAGTR